MKRNSSKSNVHSTKSRDLMCKMATVPDWHTTCLHTQKFANSRPRSSYRVCSRNGFQDVFRPSSTTAVANPMLSSLDVKRILFQKIADKGQELIKAFRLLDASRNMTVSKSELRRIVTTFLLPLTREQFQGVLAQIPLTSSDAVPYLEFLSRFGGLDLNITVTKRDSGNEMSGCRTLKELGIQIGEKILRNMKSVISALKLIDVNRTGRVQPRELRRVLETFCVQMKDEEYRRFAEHYNINKDTAVDYYAFLKNFSINNNLNFTNCMGNQEVSRENQQVRNSARCYLPTSGPSEATWEDGSLDELGRTYCQELSKSHEMVEKALSAGDPSKCGYISLNYLKVVLDTFVHRLPRRTFIQLMKRFGLKTTSKVNWKQFLALLRDPRCLDVNAVPLAKKNGTDSGNQCRRENIITKLLRCEDDYKSLKKALLVISTKTDDQMKGEELRRVINGVVAKMSDSEFKELMQTLDPRGTGLVSVHTLIALLEENPKIGKRPRSADTKTPLPLAWDSVGEMVCDAVGRNPLPFQNLLQSYDLGGTGLMGAHSFKKVMHMFCPCLTAGHLTKLCSEFQDAASGKVLYRNLLASLGVSGLPAACPVPAPKDRPPRGHVQQEEQQQPSHAKRTKPTENKSTLTRNVTRDEAAGKLRSWVEQQDPAFKHRFLHFGKEPSGRVSVRDFRKVLEDSGMPMDDDQYAQLTAKIGYKKEGMTYLDFATIFGSSSSPDVNPTLPGPKVSEPQVAPSQTAAPPQSDFASYFVSAEECLRLLPQRLKESFQDLYSAFFRMDTDRDGIISMRDLHRLLQPLFTLKDEEFERLLGLLGLRLSVTLNFREFRNLFEKTPPSAGEAPQRLIRSKRKVADSELACDQAHQYLVTKAKNRWSDLSKNFIETDSEGAGILRRLDVKNALYGFDIPLTPREFEKLWMRYDTERKGHITYQEFLQKLGIAYSADVHRPYVEDLSNFMGHFTKPQPEQEGRPEQQPSTEPAEPARHELKDHYQDIREALLRLDKCRSGSVSLGQVQRALQEGGCPLQEEELTELLGSWGISWQNDSVNYLDFLRAVENSQPSGPELIDFAKLGAEEVLKSVQQVVASSGLALSEAFSAVDKEDTGFVTASDFGEVLKDFCYKLTDNQYHYFLRKLRIHLTPSINWKYFLQNFSGFREETAAKWAEKMPKGPPPTSPKDMVNPELLAQLHKAVAAHYHAIAQDFENFDTTNTNTISRDEFRAVCTRHIQILTDEQFDGLWSAMPVDAKGRLKCPDFLSRFGAEKVAAQPSTSDSTKAHRGSEAPGASEGSSVGPPPPRDLRTGSKLRTQPCTPGRAGTAPGTPPLQNCEPIESKLRGRVQGCWRTLLKECKERDALKQGDIATAEFLALVEKFHLDVSPEEQRQLTTKYDLRNNGRFAYCDFIQSCVLLLKAKETSLMQRMKIQNTHRMTETGVETSSLYCALLRIQPQILHCWRPMRRSFKAYDEGGTGMIGVADFRKVLRQYGINLSEEEFFHILEYYDKTLSSRISYNDFLRAFLQ
ncbi:EF-hand calcium-binding domain-containing protein 6 isoform 2-T2 [Molossus nigricans]